MKLLLLLCSSALVIAGCSKPAGSAAAVATPSRSDAVAPAPQYVTTVAENRPAANVTGEVNAFLTEQLHVFIQQKQRLPSDFAELARTRLDSVPRPPEGRKWIIDAATRQVKAAAIQ